jgi:hypothetical protein
MRVTGSVPLFLFDLAKLTSYEAPHYAVLSRLLLLPPLLVLIILLGTPFSNTLNLCSSLSVRDQVSCAFKTSVKNYDLYIFLNLILKRSWIDKRLGRE